MTDLTVKEILMAGILGMTPGNAAEAFAGPAKDPVFANAALDLNSANPAAARDAAVDFIKLSISGL